MIKIGQREIEVTFFKKAMMKYLIKQRACICDLETSEPLRTGTFLCRVVKKSILYLLKSTTHSRRRAQVKKRAGLKLLNNC